MRLQLALLAIGLAACTTAEPPRAPPFPPEPAPVAPVASASSSPAVKPAAAPALGALDQIQHDARALDPLVTTPFAHRFLAAAAALPHVTTRLVYKTKDKKRWFTAKEAAALAPNERAALDEVKDDEELYYNTKYGSPLSYARAIDVLAQAKLIPEGGGEDPRLRLRLRRPPPLAREPRIRRDRRRRRPDAPRRFYTEPGDLGSDCRLWRKQGRERPPPRRPLPRRRQTIQRAAGSGYDVFISKNTLKKGYIHPDRAADSEVPHQPRGRRRDVSPRGARRAQAARRVPDLQRLPRAHAARQAVRAVERRALAVDRGSVQERQVRGPR